MVVGAVQALILSAAAFSWKTDNRPAARTFGGLMLVFAVLIFNASYNEVGAEPPPEVPYGILHLWGALALLIGPLVYFHVRTSVDDSYHLLTLPRLIHVVLPAVHLSLLLPFLFVGPELRDTYEAVYRERALYRSFVPGVRIGLIVNSLYVLGAHLWIRRFEAHVIDVASFGDETRVRWLKILILLLLALMFLLGFATFGEPIPFVAAVALVAFTSTITFIGLARPHLFHAIPKPLRLQPADTEEEKYASSQLDDPQKEEFLRRITTHFETKEPFLEHDLTLSQVAEQVDIPYRFVSQVINEKLGSHFMDFVNGYRIDRAKALLLDPDFAHLSIDGIAAEAGFRSRSAFYAAFKKGTGQTPGAYRKNPGADESATAG